MPDWISHEPALWVGGLTAAIDLAIAFGAPISPDQRIAVLGFGAAIVAIVGAVIVRQNVVPLAKIEQVPIAAVALEQSEALDTL